MERGSLRLRLTAAWLMFILLTLQVAAIGLLLLFERSISRRTVSELTIYLRQLSQGIEVADNGAIKLSDVPPDPHFVMAYSGHYWQISKDGVPILRSPSLWDQTLNVDVKPPPSAEPTIVRLTGPDDQNLFGIVRTVVVGRGDKKSVLQILAAVDHAEILADTHKFASELWIGLSGLAFLLLLAAWAHVSIGLKPLKELRARLSAVRNGEVRRLEGVFPNEVMPLVAETNALLDAQDEALEAARTRAANLAHGLKTPLAVMATQSRLLRRRGDWEIADEIDRQVESMRRHVERELARTRARGAGKTRHERIDAAAAVREIAGALQLLPNGRELTWHVAIPAPLMLPVHRADFDDIMGNLLDNGQKWARSRIQVDGQLLERSVIFSVEDDGPGVPDDQVERILQWGERAETSVPGSGLGLAIVSDLVALYGGRLEIARSSLGGLKAAVVLPTQ